MDDESLPSVDEFNDWIPCHEFCKGHGGGVCDCEHEKAGLTYHHTLEQLAEVRRDLKREYFHNRRAAQMATARESVIADFRVERDELRNRVNSLLAQNGNLAEQLVRKQDTTYERDRLREQMWQTRPNSEDEDGVTWAAYAADLDMQYMEADAECDKLRVEVARLRSVTE